MERHEDPCVHDAWSCNSGWHECTDCQRGLGSRHNQLEPHAATDCLMCQPTSSCVHNSEEICGYCAGVIRRRFNGSGKTITKQEIRDTVADGVAQKYITKDSGQRIEYDSGMRRDVQEGKPRFDLLLQEGVPYEDQFLTRFAALLGRGAEKYGERNWQLANSTEELARFRASALRHVFQWAAGETDEDHAAATAFNLMAYEYLKGKLDRDENSSL